jgi:hypothetical protein
VSLPLQIVKGTGGDAEVIRDFGVVSIDADKTFTAKVNFNRDRGDATIPEATTPEPGNDGLDEGDLGSGGSVDSGGSGSSGSPGSGVSDNGASGDVGSERRGSGGGGSDGGFLSNAANGIRRLLPGTGGMVFELLARELSADRRRRLDPQDSPVATAYALAEEG